MLASARTIPYMIRKEVVDDPKMSKSPTNMIGAIYKGTELTASGWIVKAVDIVGFLVFAIANDRILFDA